MTASFPLPQAGPFNKKKGVLKTNSLFDILFFYTVKPKVLELNYIRGLQSKRNKFVILLRWGFRAETTFFGEWVKKAKLTYVLTGREILNKRNPLRSV